MSRKPKTKTKPVRRIVIREGSPNRTPIKKRPAAIAEAAERLVELHSMKTKSPAKRKSTASRTAKAVGPGLLVSPSDFRNARLAR